MTRAIIIAILLACSIIPMNASDYTATQAIVQQLLADSSEVIQDIIKSRKSLEPALIEHTSKIDTDDFWRDYWSILQAHDTQHPLYLLSECEGSTGVCHIGRSIAPKYRSRYSAAVAHELVTKLEQQPVVTYADFATGAMLQALYCITHVLNQKPDAVMNLHFIDLLHSAYRRSAQPNIDLLNNESERDDFISSLVNLEQIKQDTAVPGIQTARRAQQCINFLRTAFPSATLSLYVHSNSADYRTFLKEQPVSYPDVLTTVDIEDYESRSNGAIHQYKKLCGKTLRKSPSSVNIRLHGVKKQLISYRYSPKDDSFKKSITQL